MKPNLLLIAFCAAFTVHSACIGQPDCTPSRLGNMFALQNIAQFDDLVAVVDRTGLTTFDMTVPSQPRQLGRLDFPSTLSTTNTGFDIDRTPGNPGLMLFTLSANRCILVSLADPSAPTILSEFERACGYSLGRTAIARFCDVPNRVGLFDINDPAASTPASEFLTQDDAQGVAEGNLLFLKNFTSTIVYDITDPRSPMILTTLPYSVSAAVENRNVWYLDTNEGVRAVTINGASASVLWLRPGTLSCISGSNLYITETFSTSARFTQYDVSNPETPHILGIYAGTAGAAAFSDHTLRADGPVESKPWVVPEPVSPRVITTSFQGYLQGNLAVIAAGSRGVHFYDLSDQASPRLLSTIDTPGTASMVRFKDQHVFVADRSGGLIVIDSSDPATPVIVARNTVMSPVKIDLSNSTLAAIGSNIPLQLFDIADPADPRPAATTDYSPSFAAVYGTSLWTSGSIGLIYNSVPPDLSRIDKLGRFLLGDAAQIILTPRLAYAAYPHTDASNIRIFSRDDPPIPLGTYSIGTGGRTIWFTLSEHDRMWVSSSAASSRLNCIDVSNPSHPTLSGGLNLEAPIGGLAAHGDHLLAIYGASGFQIFRLPPDEPARRPSTLRTFASPAALAVSESDALFKGINSVSVYQLTENHNGKRLYSVTLPSDPSRAVHVPAHNGYLVFCNGWGFVSISEQSRSITGTLRVEDTPYWLGLQDSLAVTVGPRSLSLFDVTDPSHMTPRGVLPLPTNLGTRHVVMSDGILIIARNNRFFDVIDLHDPDRPTIIASFAADAIGDKPAFDGRWLYHPQESSLVIFDLLNPAAPSRAGSIDARAGDLLLHAGRLYGTSNILGNAARIYDLVNPASPHAIGTWGMGSPWFTGSADLYNDSRGTATFYNGSDSFVVRLPGPEILDQPRSTIACIGNTVTLSVRATDGSTFAWRRDGSPLRGENASSLTIDRVAPRDFAFYDCLVTDLNGCLTVESSAASLSGCPADLNCDRMIDCFDFIDFIDWFDAGDSRAEINGDDFIDFFDFIAFIDLFESGCP